MNPFQIEDMLKGMPDQALVKEMFNPGGSAPQYLIISEIQRRKKLRAEGAAEPQPQTSIVDEMKMSMMQQGQQPQGMPQQGAPQQGYADGGLVTGYTPEDYLDRSYRNMATGLDYDYRQRNMARQRWKELQAGAPRGVNTDYPSYGIPGDRPGPDSADMLSGLAGRMTESLTPEPYAMNMDRMPSIDIGQAQMSGPAGIPGLVPGADPMAGVSGSMPQPVRGDFGLEQGMQAYEYGGYPFDIPQRPEHVGSYLRRRPEFLKMRDPSLAGGAVPRGVPHQRSPIDDPTDAVSGPSHGNPWMPPAPPLVPARGYEGGDPSQPVRPTDLAPYMNGQFGGDVFDKLQGVVRYPEASALDGTTLTGDAQVQGTSDEGVLASTPVGVAPTPDQLPQMDIADSSADTSAGAGGIGSLRGGGVGGRSGAFAGSGGGYDAFFDAVAEKIGFKPGSYEQAYDIIQQKIDAMEVDAKSGREKDKWLALANMGAAIAAGQSPYFASNLGAGMMTGIESLRQAKAAAKAEDMQFLGLDMQMLNAREAARRGDVGTAADLYNMAIQESLGRAKISASMAGSSTQGIGNRLDVIKGWKEVLSNKLKVYSEDPMSMRMELESTLPDFSELPEDDKKRYMTEYKTNIEAQLRQYEQMEAQLTGLPYGSNDLASAIAKERARRSGGGS